MHLIRSLCQITPWSNPRASDVVSRPTSPASVMFQCQAVNGSVVYDNATEANPGEVGLISEESDEEV